MPRYEKTLNGTMHELSHPDIIPPCLTIPHSLSLQPTVRDPGGNTGRRKYCWRPPYPLSFPVEAQM